MEIRKVNASVITETVKKLFMDMNYFIGEDILTALKNAEKTEISPTGKSVLSQLIENHKIAKEEEVPICQDTGMAVLFVEYGDKVVIEGGNHAQFGDYGIQFNDGVAKISKEEQLDITIREILKFLKKYQ